MSRQMDAHSFVEQADWGGAKDFKIDGRGTQNRQGDAGALRMILPKLRNDLDIMLSPVADRPGLLIRDFLRYSDAKLIIPPRLIPGLRLFNGTQTVLDLQAELARISGVPETGTAAGLLIAAMSDAGFLEDDTYTKLRSRRLSAFAQSPVREAAHAGSAYPEEIGSLQNVMRKYLDGAASTQERVMAIAAPHVSPQGGWQSYRAAYQELAPDLRGRTFVVLGTSHHGKPGKFGLTRKVFETPFGRTRIDEALVAELESQPAALVEDYCHAVEHSIEFQVLFLQAIFGPDVRILPVLCGSFGRSILAGGIPEDDDHVKRFLGALGTIAEREHARLFWVLGVDMAHKGLRFADGYAAHADRDEMTMVGERDKLRIACINASDAPGFWDLVKENGDDLKWCGSAPIYTFMKAVPQARGKLLRYEQWNIDENSVVSFAAISFAF
jgi:MEMO1 family protein